MATLVTDAEVVPRSQPSVPPGAFVYGVPLAWGAVLLLHPTGGGERFYPIVSDQVGRWLLVHVATMVFVPLMAAVLYVLVRGLQGTAARVSRLAIPVFAVIYMAWEAILGVGTGLLVEAVDDGPAADRASGAALVEDFTDGPILRVLEYVGSLAWIVALVAAAVALRRAHSLHWGFVVLFAVAAPLITAHVPPLGPVGLVMFVVGVFIVRQRAGAFAA